MKLCRPLGQMRDPGESYSDVIIRLAEGDGDLIRKSPLLRPR
jgi:predicted CopG family antitoxin